MNRTHEAHAVLGETLAALRGLAKTALDEQSFSDVVEIARIAEEVAAIVGAESAGARPASNPAPPVARLATPRSPRRSPSKSYPRFDRDGDKLVKIGWSKRAREEYEHRAPFVVAELLVSAIRKKVTEGELFSTTDIFPLTTAGGGGTVPNYQAYLALKWLHMEGVISKHGRDKYAIEPGKISDGTLRQLWQQLTSLDGGVGRNGANQ